MKNIPWYILAEVSEEKPDHVGIFLGCNGCDELTSKVNFSLRLISLIEKKYEISCPATTHFFTKKLKTWGWSQFVKLSELNDKEKGLLTDGEIRVKLSATFVE